LINFRHEIEISHGRHVDLYFTKRKLRKILFLKIYYHTSALTTPFVYRVSNFSPFSAGKLSVICYTPKCFLPALQDTKSHTLPRAAGLNIILHVK